MKLEVSCSDPRPTRPPGSPQGCHLRDGSTHATRILREEKAGAVGAVLHCFSGDRSQERVLPELGIELSFGGTFTVENAGEHRAVARSSNWFELASPHGRSVQSVVMTRSPARRTSDWRRGLRTELPRLLREDLQVRGQVIAVLSEYLTTREETAAILAELRQMRADFDRRMDEQGRRIEEHTRRLGSLERTLGAIGARWGIMSEEAFREGVRTLFAEQPEVHIEHWRGRDDRGHVFGHPAEIELDAVVRDGLHVLVEIESSVSPGDVVTFARKADLYTAQTGKTPRRRLIISPFVDAQAMETARRLGIEVCAASTPPLV